jgi:hypothetical protein
MIVFPSMVRVGSFIDLEEGHQVLQLRGLATRFIGGVLQSQLHVVFHPGWENN